LLVDGDRTAGDIAAHFRTSRPGISRHLRVLREHGLVSSREDGRRRVYSLEAAPLAELDRWLSRYRTFWTSRLDALDVELRRRRKEQR
jgi:DNA-binding transcriptional ArsR family regulator